MPGFFLTPSYLNTVGNQIGCYKNECAVVGGSQVSNRERKLLVLDLRDNHGCCREWGGEVANVFALSIIRA